MMLVVIIMFRFKGWIGKDSVTYIREAVFSDISTVYRFVPRLWAQTKINYLLNEIEIYGEIDELVNQVIELSLTFQILTLYTAFYVDPTDISETEKIVPGEFKLFANYPNPFNPSTTIKYSLPAGQSVYNVTIKIYNPLGQLVEILVYKHQSPGLYTIK